MKYKNSAPRNRAWQVVLPTLVAGLMISVTAMAAPTSDTDKACEPTQVQEWPICNPEAMDAASSPMSPLPHLKAETFARELGAPLPGRARMELSGVVSGGGASCVSHVASVTGDADMLLSPLAQRKQKRMEFTRKSLAGKTVPHRVVFHLYTPNIEIQQGGMVMDAFSFRHAGIGGWRPNSGANLKIYLPETSPDELVAGESYPAFAQTTGGEPGRIGWFYTDWQGRSQPVYYGGPVPPEITAMCAGLQKDLNRMHDGLVAETGDQSLRGRPNIASSCETIKEIAFAGDKRYVTGELDGAVVIDSITNGNIAGHFELSGQARLTDKRFDFDYDNRSGRLTGNRLTNETETGAGLSFSGRFNAPNYLSGRYTPAGQTVVVTGDNVANEENLLHIRSHLPRRQQRNVDWDDPGIRVTFDRPVDITSLDSDSFYLEYRDGNRQLQKVAASYARPGPATVRLVPRAELKDGVRYRVQIRAGRNGVLGERGEPLDLDYSWSFYTMVDLDDDQAMPDLDRNLDKTEGIEPHVFQVSRDTRLVPDKPTLARVYVKWKKRDDVAEDWQVERFLASVQIRKDGPKGAVIASKKKVAIQRPDQYRASDKRFADNSVNLFNLDISNQPKNIVAEVRPKTKCETTPRKFFSAGHSIPGYVANPKDLTLAYYLIKPKRAQDRLGSSDKAYWTDGIPAQARADAQIIARKGANFTRQNFPVRDVNAIYGGGIAIGIGWASTDKNNVGRSRIPEQFLEDGQIPLDYTQKVIETRAYDALMAWRQKGDPTARAADIFMLFLPPGTAGPAGGGAYAPRAVKPGKPGMVDIWLDRSINQYISKHIVDVAHETGHVFGLMTNLLGGTHTNRVLQGPPAPYVHPGSQAGSCEGSGDAGPIEGFRIALDGKSGQNKSMIEGNGSSQGKKTYPLMSCGQTPVEGTFIADASYKYLLRRIPRLAQNDWLHSRLRLAASDPVAVPLDDYWAVSGFARPDGSAALIDSVVPTGRQQAPPASDGDFEAVLEDADGQTLATRDFELDSSPAATGARTIDSFRVLLPRRAQAKTIVIRNDGKVIQRYTRSDHPPSLSELAAKADADGGITVSWKGTDPDGDKLAYDVYYTTNGRDFHPRAIGLRADHFTLSPEDRFPGADSRIRVVASDGFDQASDSVALPGQGTFSVLSTLPADTGDTPRNTRIEASFNADLAQDAITDDTFILEDTGGKRVEATLEYRRADYTAILLPKQPLITGMRYTATLSADIADRYDNTLGEPVTWQFTPPLPPREDPASYADAEPDTGDEDPQGQGWLELAGRTRQSFKIVRCERTDKMHGSSAIHVRGEGASGLRVGMHAIEVPGSPLRQQVQVSSDATIYQRTLQQTDQGWETAAGEPADGPLINIRDDQITVDADLPVMVGDKGPQHARIEASCTGLTSHRDE